MLKDIQIRNFLCNKKLDVDFSPTVTTIIGKTAAGKSSAIRALWWVLTNNPDGDEFINWDAKKAVVRLTIENDNLIIRSKGKGRNKYILNEEEFTAFGNGVPDEIAKLLNISEINFQGQFDMPFWFSETAGEVSRQLNRIVNLEVIDTTLANIASEIRKNKTEIELVQDRVGVLTEQKKELGYVVEMDEDLQKVENLQDRLEKKTVKRATIGDLIEKATNYQAIAVSSSKQATQGKFVIDKGQVWQDKQALTERLRYLTYLVIGYQKHIDNKPPSIKPLEDMKIKIANIKMKICNLEGLVGNYKNYTITWHNALNEVKKVKEQLERIKVCPLCERPM